MTFKGWSIRVERRDPRAQSLDSGLSPGWQRLVPRLAIVHRYEGVDPQEVFSRVQLHLDALKNAPSSRSKKNW